MLKALGKASTTPKAERAGAQVADDSADK